MSIERIGLKFGNIYAQLAGMGRCGLLSAIHKHTFTVEAHSVVGEVENVKIVAVDGRELPPPAAEYVPLAWSRESDIHDNSIWLAWATCDEAFSITQGFCDSLPWWVLGESREGLLPPGCSVKYSGLEMAQAACEAINRQAWDAQHTPASPPAVRFEREELGRVVHQSWIDAQSPGVRHIYATWGDLNDAQKSWNYCVGEAVANYVLTKLRAAGAAR